MTIIIRPETPDDIDAVYEIEQAAFGQPDEANLVNRLRDGGKLLLSFLALIDDVPVGHIAYSPVTIEHKTGNFAAIGLAPVAVLPAYQKQGVGAALINESLDVLSARDYDLVFLIGHPAYYPRFGFVPAMLHGFDCDYTTPGEANLHFMVKELRAGALSGKSGYLHYAPEFEGV